MSRAVTVNGRVTQFRFINPHVLIYAEVGADDGSVVEWSGELTSPNRLARAASGGGATNVVHWSRETLVPGQEIELTGNPARNGAPSMRVTRVVDAEGRILLGGEEPQADTIVAVRSFDYIHGAVPANDGGDLRGVWMRRNDFPHQNYAFSEELPPMTPWAMERWELSKPTFGPRGVPVAETNDPVYECFPPGTPRIYFHPFPIEIIQLPGRVVMIFEYDHLLRQIYTDGRDHRDDLAPMWMGDSTGHWEGDTLVVETVNFNDQTWIDRRGVPHSEELRVIERIRRAGDDLLRVDITVEDPVAFTEPWSGRRYYERVDWNIEEFVCMDSAAFEEYEQEVLEYGGNQAGGSSPAGGY